MQDFLKTPTGKIFYEKHVPDLVQQIKRLGDILESMQKDQQKERLEEKKRYKIDQRKMIAEAIEEYKKNGRVSEDGV
jgi:hypothetical protein